MSAQPYVKQLPDTRSWREEAACRDLPTSLFFPKTIEDEERAVAVQACASCPVQTQCRDFALETRQEFGIWGGKTVKEINSMRRRLKKRHKLEQELRQERETNGGNNQN